MVQLIQNLVQMKAKWFEVDTDTPFNFPLQFPDPPVNTNILNFEMVWSAAVAGGGLR